MTTPTLDPDAYRRGWHDSANGALARVPDEYETDAEISGWIRGWTDYVISGMGKDKNNGPVRNDALSLQQHGNA